MDVVEKREVRSEYGKFVKHLAKQNNELRERVFRKYLTFTGNGISHEDAVKKLVECFDLSEKQVENRLASRGADIGAKSASLTNAMVMVRLNRLVDSLEVNCANCDAETAALHEMIETGEKYVDGDVLEVEDGTGKLKNKTIKRITVWDQIKAIEDRKIQLQRVYFDAVRILTGGNKQPLIVVNTGAAVGDLDEKDLDIQLSKHEKKDKVIVTIEEMGGE